MALLGVDVSIIVPHPRFAESVNDLQQRVVAAVEGIAAQHPGGYFASNPVYASHVLAGVWWQW